MKITVYEARAFAFNTLREKIPVMKNIEMVFSLDDDENNKIIRAIVNGMKPGLAHMLLMRLGITDNYDQSKEMIDKALSAK